MHMADGLLSPSVATTMYVASGIATIYSIHKLKKEDLKEKIHIMGIMGAFIFATQMIDFTIPGIGSSGHLCGGIITSSVLCFIFQTRPELLWNPNKLDNYQTIH